MPDSRSSSSWCLLPAVLPAAAGAKVRKGPAGDAFYTPPSPLPPATTAR